MLKNKHKSMTLNTKSAIYLTTRSNREMNMANSTIRYKIKDQLRRIPIPILVDSRHYVMIGSGSCA